MSFFRFDPARGFEGLSRRMNSLVQDFEKGITVEYGGFVPKADITENETNVFFEFELAGLSKEDVKVTINEENVLTIKGEKKRPEKNGEEAENKCFIRCERNFGQFTRSFLLPDNVKKESISAKYEHGVLLLTFEKIQPVMPKEIEVEIG